MFSWLLVPHDETRLVECKEAGYGWWWMKLLRATSKFDVPALKLGSALHMRYRHPVFLVIRYFYLLLVPIGILIAFTAGAENRLDRILGLMMVVAGPVLFIRKYFWQYRLIRGAKSSPQAGQEVHWEFTEEGFQQHSESHESEFKWSDFSDRLLSPKAILIYPEKDLYFILPREAFESQDDFLKVTKWCETKIVPKG